MAEREHRKIAGKILVSMTHFYLCVPFIPFHSEAHAYRYSIGLVEHFVTECRPASGVIHLVHGIAVCIVVKKGLASIRRRCAALLAGAGGSTDSGGHRPQRREEGGKQKQFTLNGIWIHRCGGIVKQTITGSIVQ